MKILINSILLAVIVLATSCTEEVITLLKEHSIDTVYVDVPQPPDTVKIIVVQYDTIDNIVIKDSIITQTIIQLDTIIICHIIRDTIYITQYYIHPNYQFFVDRFYAEAKAYGWGDLPKNNLYLTKWEIEDIQNNGYPPWYKGEGVSIAYQENHQWYVKLNALMREDRWFIPIMRELGHAVMGKPYTDDPEDIMNPLFDPRRFTEREYDDPIARPYLDKLFKRE